MPGIVICIHVCVPARVWDIFRSTVSYIYYSATYFQTLVTFSFCNIDDVTWGTKGLSGGAKNNFFEGKVQHVSTWLVVNACLTFGLILIDSFGEDYAVIN